MSAQSTLLPLIQDRIDAFLDRAQTDLERISPLAAPLMTQSRALMSGGKRLRAMFCYWGWRSVESIERLDEQQGRDQLECVLALGTAIEFFHAAALVHDDVIDHSDTRRGIAAAHVEFSSMHRRDHWRGDADQFGASAAIVLGDVLLGWAHAQFAAAVAALPGDARQQTLCDLIAQMTSDVMIGQYLDIVGEHAWPALPDDESLQRAETVLQYKSARYSVEQPLLLGALVGGGDQRQLQALAKFGSHAGLAFQLRDDVLGVFGDPAVTGKPAGDDLREGKRTVLVALARSAVPAGVRHVLDDLLGDPDLSDSQVSMLQTTITESGALQSTERLIDDHYEQAIAALDGAGLSAEATLTLTDLAERAARRHS